MTLADDALSCARELVRALVEGGVRDACVSPGSRSTAIALALAREPAIRVHVHLDERSSAFFALGLAKGSRRPVAVATTSGTAAAEPFPAVIEASQSRVRLVMLTADRPPWLRDTGANQTIDQRALFGSYARAWFDLPVAGSGSEPEWRRAAEEALAAASIRPAGPVHLNLPFDEPLVPTEQSPERRPAVPDLGDEKRPSPFVISQGLEPAVSGARGLLVAGPADEPPHEWLDLARRLGWPALAEPLSGIRTNGALTAGQALIRSGWLDAHRPEVVVQIGAAPTSKATQNLVAGGGKLVVVDDDHLEPDPGRKASLRVKSAPRTVAEFLLEKDLEQAPPGWLDAWSEADHVAREALDRTMEGWDEPFEPRIARDMADRVPDGGVFFVGNSSPVRDLDLAMRPRDGLRILANRGASGIDGLVSTSLGIACAAPTAFALIGDLSVLHDFGSVVWSAGRTPPDLTFVVIDNGGGALFAQLPQRRLPEFAELFETRHGADIEALAEAAGVGTFRVQKAGELGAAIEAATRREGIRLVVVEVDPELGLRRREELDAAVDSAIRGTG